MPRFIRKFNNTHVLIMPVNYDISIMKYSCKNIYFLQYHIVGLDEILLFIQNERYSYIALQIEAGALYKQAN